jgi:hypothetical protein
MHALAGCQVTRNPVEITPKFGTIKTWCAISGQSRSRAYEALAAGNLKAVKEGVKTLIDIEGGLAWLRTLPQAQFGQKKAA